SIVAGRDHHDDACMPCLLNCLAQWVAGVALIDRPAHRQIDDSDVVGVLQLDSRLDGLDDEAVAALAGAVQYAKVNQTHVGRHALDDDIAPGASGVAAISTDDAGDVRAVAISVVGTTTGEVLTVLNTRLARQAQIV